MKLFTWAFSMLALAIACGLVSNDSGRIAGTNLADTCDNPDAAISCYFKNMPANPGSTMIIASPGEHGERLVITGTLSRAQDAQPFAGALIYAYHTNTKGRYEKKGNESGVQRWHGYLHGWCKTDAYGRYEIQTIRPARYPDNSMPAHIHAAIKEPSSGNAFHISDFVFADDSLVNEQYTRSLHNLTGGTGIVGVRKTPDGVWEGNGTSLCPDCAQLAMVDRTTQK